MTAFETLLDRARSGDLAARKELLGQVRPFIRAIARRLLHGDDEASDLAHEVLLRMDGGFASFRGHSSWQLLAWARAIGSNILIDRGRRPRLPTEPLPPDLGASVDNGPLSGLVHAEDMARLAEALERLPEHYRAVVQARLFEGISCVDIARRMGKTPVWVSVTCLRAVRCLRQELGEQS
jgi:RNA polymerase sigma-70 factor (ECF subfamily)